MINIEEIRDKIARATPAPWGHFVFRGDFPNGEPVTGAIGPLHEMVDIEDREAAIKLADADAALMIAAVNNLTALCDEVERLRAENKTQHKYIRDLEIELRDLQRRVRQLYGALEGAKRIASEYYAFGLEGFEGEYTQIVNQLKDELPEVEE